MLLTPKTLAISPVFTIVQNPSFTMFSSNRISSLQSSQPICIYPNTPCFWIYSVVSHGNSFLPFPCQNFALSEGSDYILCHPWSHEDLSWKQSLDSELVPCL
jgi:hypothetical protein